MPASAASGWRSPPVYGGYGAYTPVQSGGYGGAYTPVQSSGYGGAYKPVQSGGYGAYTPVQGGAKNVTLNTEWLWWSETTFCWLYFWSSSIFFLTSTNRIRQTVEHLKWSQQNLVSEHHGHPVHTMMPTNISSLQAITIRPKPHTTSEAGSDLAYNCIGKRSCQQNTFSKLTLTTNAEKQTNEPYIHIVF